MTKRWTAVACPSAVSGGSPTDLQCGTRTLRAQRRAA